MSSCLSAAVLPMCRGLLGLSGLLVQQPVRCCSIRRPSALRSCGEDAWQQLMSQEHVPAVSKRAGKLTGVQAAAAGYAAKASTLGR